MYREHDNETIKRQIADLDGRIAATESALLYSRNRSEQRQIETNLKALKDRKTQLQGWIDANNRESADNNGDRTNG